MGGGDILARHRQRGGERRLEAHDRADVGAGAGDLEVNAPFGGRLRRAFPGAVFPDQRHAHDHRRLQLCVARAARGDEERIVDARRNVAARSGAEPSGGEARAMGDDRCAQSLLVRRHVPAFAQLESAFDGGSVRKSSGSSYAPGRSLEVNVGNLLASPRPHDHASGVVPIALRSMGEDECGRWRYPPLRFTRGGGGDQPEA